MKSNIRAWTIQLQREYDDICHRYGVDLRIPVIEVSGATKELGSWNPATRSLRISQKLIGAYSWSVTLQVLKHEMAHQLCSDLFKCSKLDHGKEFQRACIMLGVSPEFRRYLLSEPFFAEGKYSQGEQIANDLGSNAKVLLKVEKLFALGESSNRHEAALAIQKANQLLQKYHLEYLQDKGERYYTTSIIELKRKRMATYKRHICMILQEYFYVRVVLSTLYDQKENDTFKVIELFGAREKVEVARYCYHFLENQLGLYWQQEKSRYGRGAHKFKNSYFLGVLQGFYRKLQSTQHNFTSQTPDPEFKELMVAEEKRLAEYVAIYHPRLRKNSNRQIRLYKDSYDAGVQTGRNMNFSKPVSQNNKRPSELE